MVVTGLTARGTTIADRRSWRLVVEAGSDLVATVDVGPRRQALHVHGALDHRIEPIADDDRPDPAAWPVASAHRAASARWAQRHPTIATVSHVRVEPGQGGRIGAAIEVAGAHLVDAGIRRLDLRVPFDDPFLDQLTGERWVRGSDGDAIVASLALHYPWSVERGPLTGPWARLPLPARRVVRRLSAMHPQQVPELLRTGAAELAAAVGQRQAPPRHRSRAADGAPAGTFPFQVTRHRTISAALDLLSPSARRSTFVDIGCGDGRVLKAAVAHGFDRVHGRELDPALAEQARHAVAGHGDVLVGDGLVEPLPDEAGVVFLFNPFDDAHLARLAALIGESLARRPRPLVVVYVNPQPIQPLEAVGLVLVEANPSFSILATRAG